MDRGMVFAVSAMRSAERRTEFTAHNLANLSTHGFKRRLSSDREYRVQGQGSGSTVATAGARDWSQGTLDHTGSPMHLALRGRGFFTAESPSGPVHTRRGEFVVSESGEITTPEGYPLAWAQRSGRFDPSGPDIRVEENAVVHQGERRLGRLEISDFENYSGLSELNSGYWLAGPNVKTTNAEAQVRQGALETSNVNGIDEMIDLIAAQRQYELAARGVRMVDQSYQRLNRSR